MVSKFTASDFITRIMPGGFVIAVVYFTGSAQILQGAESIKSFDLLYSFFFVTTAFILGEILQTFAHLIEFVFDIFFKGYRPSEIFLYSNNPILKDDLIRMEVIKKLELTEEDVVQLQSLSYSQLPLISSKKSALRLLPQRYFWKIYTAVETEDAVKQVNQSYLYSRVMTTTFLVLVVWFYFSTHIRLALLALAVFLMILWRTRGVARSLIFKSVLLFLKQKV